ncbi:MAG: hypothetical protein LBH18_02365 [Spirochaetaceae bacterium]|jgi:L-arabinose isomerase|nr:hypothetical protein [Spirochaetaceae bacterium]
MKQNNIVKSFEEGAEVSGDILTGGKEKRDIKIGLLTVGYFEYWRMYPDLKDLVAKDLATVEARLKTLPGKVIRSGMVDTLDSADAAGRLFREQNVDVVLLVGGTYTPDFISLTALDYVRHVPLIIFSIQAHENIDRAGDYKSSLRNSGIIGIAQLTGTLRKLKRDFEIVVGSVEDARAYDKLIGLVRAIDAVRDLSESNIGVIGHVFRGMYDIELSKTFLKGTFGVNLIMIQSAHLLEVWNEVSDADVKKEQEQLLKRFVIKNVGKDDVFHAVKLAIAMRGLAERFHLDAMCFLDQHYIQKQVKTSARMGASLLMENSDICVNCEGDIGGLVMMMLMKRISKRSPLMAEWGEYDADENVCFMIGHGIGTPDLAASDADVTLARTPEEWGFDGAGLNYELIMKPGPVTVGHIMEAPSGYRMLVSAGESVTFPKLNFDELQAAVRFDMNVKTYLEKIFDYGVSHHCIVCPNDISRELVSAAKLLGIECFAIS